jgi:hypothetical protein
MEPGPVKQEKGQCSNEKRVQVLTGNYFFAGIDGSGSTFSAGK